MLIYGTLLLDDMPKLVRGDSGRVVQIFTNLINNSIKFTTGKCVPFIIISVANHNCNVVVF